VIAKFISVLGGVEGVVDYVENKTHVAEVVGHSLTAPVQQRGQIPAQDALGVAGMDAIDALVEYVDQSTKTGRDRQITAEAVAEMRERAALRPDVADTAWHHITLSYAREDRPKITDQVMAEDARSFVLAMAAAENQQRVSQRRKRFVDGDSLQYIAVCHHEKKHIHVHVILCRIDKDGQVVRNSGPMLNQMARRWCADNEERRGLVRTKAPDRDAFFVRREEGAVRDLAAERTHQAASDEQQAVVDAVHEIADVSLSEEDLAERLAQRGLRLQRAEKNGWSVTDDDGTSLPASVCGLGGRRRPDRIGRPPNAKQAARKEVWDAVAESSSWPELSSALARRRIRLDQDDRGTVRGFRRVDDAGRAVPKARWSPRDLGFRRPPRDGDESWFGKRVEQQRRQQARGGRGGPSRGHRREGDVQQQGVKTDAAGVIKLPKDRDDWHETFVQFAKDREAIAARIAAKDRATVVARAEKAKAVSQSAPSPAAHMVDQAAAVPTTAREPSAADRAAFDRDVQFVQRSLASLRRESDLATQRRLLGSRGIQLSYDQRTNAWYASRDGIVAGVPGLAGVADDGRGGKLAPVQGPAVPTPTKKADPLSVPAVKKLPKPKLPERDDRKRLPDWGP
jgi:hypothetical protein